ncbi:MAG: glycosyltransferase [Alphaproteobacteria bacterium]
MQLDPQISIVIYVKNGVRTIARALDSAIGQKGVRTEIVVIDGASADGTLERLKEYGPVIDNLVSEPDAGGFDAANKGWRLACAPIVCYLMADDWLEPGAARAIMEAFERHPEAGIISSGGRIVEETDSGQFRTVLERRGTENPLDLKTLLDIPLSGCRYWRRQTLEMLGGFNGRYPFAHDRDLLVRAVLARVPSATIDDVLYTYRQHADSRTLSGDRDITRAFLDEHHEMSGAWLRSPGLLGTEASEISQWRRLQLAESFLLDFTSRRWGQAARTLSKYPSVLGLALRQALPHRRRKLVYEPVTKKEAS